MDDINPKPRSTRLSLSLDLRFIIAILLAVIGVMLFVWKPWSMAANSARTIEVTGESKISERPDEFTFYPTYEFKNDNKETALAELTKKSDIVIAKLKELGVADEKIKTNASGFDYPIYYGADNKEATYTQQLTITIASLELAQKVQDYLVTTTPSGAVTPVSGFSDAKRKQLEDKARSEASTQARSKADQMAKNLGFKIGKVKSVTDGSGFGPMPYMGRGVAADTATTTPELTLQPGQNDLTYSVTVTYYLR